MRSIIGWRFVVYIAMPLFMASLGAINLSYDLLYRVEASSNSAEFQRNKVVLKEAFETIEADLSRLVTENAHWDEAVTKTTGNVNVAWFDQTWGKSLSMGSAYDTVAILDLKSGLVIVGNSRKNRVTEISALLGSTPLSSYADMLDVKNARQGVVSGFVSTSHGPAAIAMSPIVSPSRPGVDSGRVLYFAKNLENGLLSGLQRKLLVGELTVQAIEGGNEAAQFLKGPDNQPTFAFEWKNRDLGQLITSDSWSKAAAVLTFLVIVMTFIGFVALRLVQQLAEDENKAQQKALVDHLTGLPNRLALTQEMQSLGQSQSPYTIAFADLDGFKEVNDSYGHEIGDRLIFMVANGVRQLSQNAVLSCRLGGDEFVVLFAGEDATAHAKDFATNLIQMLKQPFDMEGRLASVGASIGIAECDGSLDVTEVLRRSDIAMYKAKTSGKNRLCVFDESFDIERTENLSIATELKSILASRNLDIVFQPVVNARTTAITGLEALARWPSTSSRHVTADKFIAIAENSGLIDSLGELILEKACFEAAQWPAVRLAVNISPIQLNNPHFVRNSLATLAKYGIETNRVEFEITETSLIHDTERAKQVFKTLQQSGIKVALDDFGSGFSSIGYLRTFHFDRIKIDKSIIGQVMSSASELAVVQGTLLVARGLSAEVTAEGIENAEQATVLRLAGCTEFQGYLYHKPLTASEVSKTLRKSKVAAAPRSVVVA
jgi:diguanylate cyclase (GGDEF)-like protein